MAVLVPLAGDGDPRPLPGLAVPPPRPDEPSTAPDAVPFGRRPRPAREGPALPPPPRAGLAAGLAATPRPTGRPGAKDAREGETGRMRHPPVTRRRPPSSVPPKDVARHVGEEVPRRPDRPRPPRVGRPFAVSWALPDAVTRLVTGPPRPFGARLRPARPLVGPPIQVVAQTAVAGLGGRLARLPVRRPHGAYSRHYKSPWWLPAHKSFVDRRDPRLHDQSHRWGDPRLLVPLSRP